MRSPFSANSEGGPYLMADAERFARWSGCETTDYEHACAALGNQSAELVDPDTVLWNRGPGTVDVFRVGDQEFVLSACEDDRD